MDPCDLRLHKGDAAVRSRLVAPPLFEFAIDSTLAKYDLATLEAAFWRCARYRPDCAGTATCAPAYMRRCR